SADCYNNLVPSAPLSKRDKIRLFWQGLKHLGELASTFRAMVRELQFVSVLNPRQIRLFSSASTTIATNAIEPKRHRKIILIFLDLPMGSVLYSYRQ